MLCGNNRFYILCSCIIAYKRFKIFSGTADFINVFTAMSLCYLLVNCSEISNGLF